MDRSRSGSGSSTDSWSIIERNSLVVSIRDDDSSDNESVTTTSDEIELAEEAYDSHDSDIEMDEEQIEDDDHNEISASEAEEAQKNSSDEESLSEDEDSIVESESEEDDEESEEEEESIEDQKKDCELVSQDELMEGDGLRYVTPGKIKDKFNSLNEFSLSTEEKWILMSLCGVLLLVTAIISSQALYQLSTPICETSPFGLQRREKISFNVRSLPQMKSPITPLIFNWAKREVLPSYGRVLRPTVEKVIWPSWENFSAPTIEEECQRPAVLTVIKKPSLVLPIFNSTEICQPHEAFSQKLQGPPFPRFKKDNTKRITPVSVSAFMPERKCVILTPPPARIEMKVPKPMDQPRSRPQKIDRENRFNFKKLESAMCVENAGLPCAERSIKPNKPKPQPRQKKFYYKLETQCKRPATPMSDAKPSEKTRKVFPLVSKKKTSLQLIKNVIKKSPVPRQRKIRPIPGYKYSPKKASEMMRQKPKNNDQCVRGDLKANRFTRSKKSVRKNIFRQKRLAYKIDAPCRANYVLNSGLTSGLIKKKQEIVLKKANNATFKSLTYPWRYRILIIPTKPWKFFAHGYGSEDSKKNYYVENRWKKVDNQ